MSGLATKYNIDIRRPISFTSNGKSISAGASNLVLERTVVGTDPVFNNIFVNGSTIYNVFRWGEGHNQNVNGDIYFNKSIDGGVTWSTPVLVQARHTVWIVTGADIVRTPSGRLVCTWFHDKGASVPSSWWSYSQYSDDDGETWSAAAKPLRTYIGDGIPPYVAGTSYSIGNQVIYNSKYYTSLTNGNLGNTPSSSPTNWTDNGSTFTGQWSSPGGSYLHDGRVFKMINYREQNSGFGGLRIVEYTEASDSWSNFSIVIPAPTLQSFEEPSVTVGPDDVIYAGIRSDVDPYKGGYISYSKDGGVKWSFPKKIIESGGKNAISISPSGTLFIGARELVARQRAAWSFDKGKTWTEGYADSGTGMGHYGDVKWSTFYDCFFHVYCSTKDGGSDFGGPMHMLCKRWNEV